MKINAIHKYTYLLLLSLFATETIQAQMKAYAEYVFNTNIPLSCNDPGGKVKVTVTGGTAPYTYTWSTGETTYSNSSPVTVTTTGTVTTTTTMLNVQTYGKYTCTVSDYNNNVITSSERPQIVVIFDTIVNNTDIDLIRNKFNAVELEVSPISKARLWEIPLTSFPFYITDSGFTYTINNIGDAVDRVKNQPGVGASGLNHDIGQPDALGGACSFGIDSQNGDNLTPLCPSGIEDITASCSNPVKIAILDSKINLTRSNILSRYNDTISNTTPIPDFCPTLHGDRVASVIQRLIASNSSIQILPITVLNSYGMGTVFDVIKGVDYANVQGAKILNMSFIGTDLIDESLSNSPLKVAIDLLKTNNALAIKAAGNNGINFSQVETKTKTFIRNGLPETKTYKYIYPPVILENTNAIAVGAYSCIGERSIFSNYDSGKQIVEIFAPGEDIFTWYGNGATDKRYSTGTSFAAPIVTGIAALLQCQNNYATVDGLKNAVLSSYPNVLKNPKAIGLKLNTQSNNSKSASGSLFNFTKKDVSCHGATDASINATIVGNPASYSYLWSNGATTSNINNLGAGIYCVTITDINGCPSKTCITITEPPALILSTTSQNATCHNSCDGSATVTAAGGTAPYTYLWDNNATSETITNLCAGTYCVTVTDFNNCTQVACVTITESTALSVSITQTYFGCSNSSIGSAQVNVSGGTPNYNYAWSNGATTASINNLAAGNYSVTITDANGCTAVADISIEEITINDNNNLLDLLVCSDEAFDIFASPSSSNFPIGLYEWQRSDSPTGPWTTISNGNSADLNNQVLVNTTSAPIIFYYRRVTMVTYMGLTCQSYSNVMQVTVYPKPVQNNLTYSVCQNTPLGILLPPTLNGLGATYHLLNVTLNGVTADPNNVPLGIGYTDSFLMNDKYYTSNGGTAVYTLVPVSIDGCIGVPFTVTINIFEPINITINQIDASCQNSCDGSATVNATGGTAPYTYQWNGGMTSLNTTTNLCVGVYTCTVTDTNGCTATTTATITEPAQLTANVTVSNVTIHGASNGSVTIAPYGGTAPYTISGNTTGLSAGTYHLSVTDANGCSLPITATITEPDPLIVSTTVTNVSCHGGSNGNVAINATGGVAPYTISGNTTNLTAGTYTFTVTDVNGATAVANATITQPAQIEVTDTSLTHIVCNGSCDGAVSLNVTGGSGNSYFYLWNTGDTTNSLSNICANDYSCTILDINGCALDISIEITEPTNPLVITDNILTYTSLGQCSGSVLFQASGGTAPYLWSNGTTATTVQLTNLCAGTHTITVEDANNCLIDAEIVINAADSLLLKTILTGKALCNNPNSGQATVIASGGRTPYSYKWSNGETTNVATQLYVGTNHCTVTDANGSKASVTILIDQEKLSAFVDSLRVPCYQENNGYILANANNCTGSLTYTYQWSNGATTQSIGNLAAGVYSCSITASNGCSSVVDNIQLLENSPILAIPTVWNSSTSVCDGKIVLNQGITTNYTYTWNHNNQTGSQIQNLCAGQYQCTISDPLSCKTVTSITVGLETPFSAVLVDQNTTHCNSANCTGFAKIQAIGGTPPYAYLWANGSTTQDINNVCEGSYNCTITDVKGKTITDTVTILKEDLPYTVDSIKMSCPNANQGYISIGCADTSCNFSYNWSNGSTNNTISNLNPGIYYCTITDNSKGCQAVEDVTIDSLNCAIKVALKVYLENINTTTGLMDDSVKTLANFPLNDPYRLSQFSNSFTHINNATNQTTTTSVLAATGNNAIVDWMFLELRQGISGSTTVAKTKAALIQRDGDIVDMDGVSPIDWEIHIPAEYFIAVRHRNHLGFRTSDKHFLSNVHINNFNFTNDSIPLYGTTPLQDKSSAIQAMIGGDANSDGSVDAFDTIVWESQNGLFDDYYNKADYNLDGSVDAFDSIIWELHNGKFQELD